MKKATKEWMEKAEDDFIVANREYKGKPPVYDAVCFHAQQCVEKYMKAVLQENDIEFEKVHDLVFLLRKLRKFIPILEKYKEELAELSSFAVEIRYPGLRASKEDATNCISVVENIRKVVKKYFGGYK